MPYLTQNLMTSHQLILNEDQRRINQTYYGHATNERNSSYPFISGDTFRAMADFVYDETRQDGLSTVKYGDVVFLKGDMLHMFFASPFDSIQNPFVLVSHNSDFYVPREHHPRLNEKKILVWYGSNSDIRNHSKMIPIPIGLNNQRWEMGRLDPIQHAFHNYRQPWDKRKIRLYINFSLRSNVAEREAASNQAKKIQGAHFVSQRISLNTYLQQVADTKFVLSPPGNGFDCHRTWEALLMGAVPIVLTSALDPLYEGIPAIIVQHWSNLTEELLSSYKYPAKDRDTAAVLYARYWRDRVTSHRRISKQ